MANNTETSSIFRIVAIVIALSLIAAGGLVFLQASGGSSSAEMAAISQSLPARAQAALDGRGGGFAAGPNGRDDGSSGADRDG